MDEQISAISPGSLGARLLHAMPAVRIVRRALRRGEAVFRQGDAATAIFVVEQGRIRLTRTLPDGTFVTVHVAEAGESFAEAALSSERYHCDAVTELPSVVLRVPKRDLVAILTANPAESLALAGALAGQV